MRSRRMSTCSCANREGRGCHTWALACHRFTILVMGCDKRDRHHAYGRHQRHSAPAASLMRDECDSRCACAPPYARASPATVIVGGMGAVGRMLRRELESDLGLIVDIDSRSGCDARGCAIPGTLERQLLAEASTVVLAVPESVALAILPALCDVLADTALIVETLSVKAHFAQAIAAARPPFEAIGINPMFAPSLGMAGRAVAVVPHLARASAAHFVSLLADRGAQVTELSAIAHDRTAAALQALPHVAILAFALAFADSQLDVEAALRLAPPPASALLALAARIADGNPEVYYEIQSANQFAPAARDALARALQEVLRAGNDADTFARLLTDVASELGDSLPQLLSTADRVVRAQCTQTKPRSAAPAGRAATPQS